MFKKPQFQNARKMQPKTQHAHLQPKYELLVKLMDTYGASSHEKPVRDVVKAAIGPYVDDMATDKLGNLICHHEGKGPKIMLAAHMDEIGLMVRGLDAQGFISVTPIGELEASNVLGDRVHISAKSAIHGIVTSREISAGEDPKDAPTFKDLIVDTGLTKAQLERAGVGPGTYLELENRSLIEGGRISGKALDDRIGCFILIEVAKLCRALDLDIFYVFTVQEETRLAGARVTTWLIEPDFGLAVDTTVADDASANPHVRLGGGPAITIKDESMIANKRINAALKSAAKRLGIPFQWDISDFGTTDASIMSISRRGVPASVVAVPVRNIHTTVELAYLADIRDTIRLLAEFLKQPPKTSLDD